jgi:hypothetical protein
MRRTILKFSCSPGAVPRGVHSQRIRNDRRRAEAQPEGQAAPLRWAISSYARGITGSFLTANEARIEDKRDPLSGGDILYQPLRMAVWAAMRGSRPRAASGVF